MGSQCFLWSRQHCYLLVGVINDAVWLNSYYIKHLRHVSLPSLLLLSSISSLCHDLQIFWSICGRYKCMVSALVLAGQAKLGLIPIQSYAALT